MNRFYYTKVHKVKIAKTAADSFALFVRFLILRETILTSLSLCAAFFTD